MCGPTWVVNPNGNERRGEGRGRYGDSGQRTEGTGVRVPGRQMEEHTEGSWADRVLSSRRSGSNRTGGLRHLGK